jgi:3-phosphoshikimate 1-carboxyvinyltransferase
LSNRLLIVRGLSGIPVRIENLSDCDDTRRLQQALATPDGTRFDLGDAGTAMRFLTAVSDKLSISAISFP